MAANPSVASNFLLTSDYPLDKIVTSGTGQFTMSASTQGYAFQAHGLPFTPLIMGSWSTTSNFPTLYGLNTGPVSATPVVSPWDAELRMRADDTYLYFAGLNYSASPVTFYVRYYGFEPSTSNEEVPSTASSFDGFQLNTDVNYPKLYKSGYVDHGEVTGASAEFELIPHDLGTNVQALIWKRESTQDSIVPAVVTMPLVYQNTISENVVAYVDSANLTLQFNPGAPSMRVHYRIYIDE